ncbi:hypothetical protein JWG39_15535 [Desulforhopalus vacuolatus]|uniref:hypothetical protein n=1 Tax=Desulforhopalus vacuolatus TaxID=40414 RepID=UPI001962308C|nr:hypothetical protein [Desulforhopalus vacuolatus]MBM9521232.1 hypothetical protein [Desulforhopalus vacuolatus]
MSRLKCVIFAISFVAIICPAFPAIPADTSGFSGMAQVSPNAFLTVNDRKNPIESGYRLGVITLTDADGIVFTPVNVDDWMHEDKEPSDLEASCAIPGRDGEFLIAESGFYNGHFGRIFHVTLLKDKEGFWVVTVNKAFKIYNRKLNAKKSSYKGDQVEGIACFNALGKIILVYGERGGLTHGGKKVGTLVWGTIDFGTYQFGKLGEASLVNNSVLGDRDCSALRLIPNEDGSVSVLSVATRDVGDNGPFHSAVYRAGRFMVDQKEKTIQFTRDAKPQILSELSGIKVEALAGPARNAAESKYSIATDDEHLGGIWRPLFGK